ncbi:hypothetical protein K503DRAFT_765162 [Rhizopogon vinicolor AM-OR11-026]|uniref:Arrestin-like N-terminal domain-containing protein n=1 Tax=Rhizopogon vinicolor AM-OR11-026 TaxID=1314800 RepID=A0A1B7NHH0_9AGAM|nr:hypothetical protein K503DRAFT_765162 [Rhizopogon vinicolor AM-OR11-026]
MNIKLSSSTPLNYELLPPSILHPIMESLPIQLLPEYTPSNPAPDYSSKPLPGEKCIQKSPRAVPSYPNNATFTYRERGITLTLKDCRDENARPTFGLGSTIRGEVALEHRQRVISVAVKLEGRVCLRDQPTIKVVTLVSKEETLWQSATLHDEVETCPGIIPLSMSFPTSYRERGQDRSFRLPPSFELSSPHRVVIVYTLQIIVTRSRNVPVIGKKFSREVRMNAQLRYCPRVRPSRPVPDCFSELKRSPEDWTEITWITKPSVEKVNNDAFLARCHFFFPSVRVFTASEKVPFHLRLDTSPAFLSSLAKLFLPQQDPSAIEAPVHVYLLRQTTVNVQGTSFCHEDVLGCGQMMLQPSTTSKVVLSESEEPVSWSWNGDLRCEVPVVNTGFSTGQITTTDYIVLSLLLPPGPLGFDSTLRRAIPIRLATERWIDRS